MFLPEYLKYFFFDTGGKIRSDKSFSKKKESENYATLIAVKRLYQYRLFGDDLYPSLTRFFAQQ